MAVRTFGEPIVEAYGESLVTGTAIKSIGFPPGVAEAIFYPAAASRWGLGPKLDICCKTTDDEVTFTDYTSQATDRNIATVVTLSSLSTAANGDYWYIGSKHKFAGCNIDIIAANTTTSAMTGYYWNGSTWVDVTITDNTGGATCLGSDGTVTFTVPSAWKKTTLNGRPGLYVIRFQVAATIDSSVTIGEISLLPDTVAAPLGYMAATTDYVLSLNTVECGSFAATAGSTSSVSITWLRHSKLGST